MKVPFLNLNALHQPQSEEYQRTFAEVLAGSRFIVGEDLAKFEQEFAAWNGPNFYAVGCANGTDAITLAAKALELPAGSEAIVPAMTFVATVEGLLQAGLKVRLADVDDGSWLLSAKGAAPKLSSRTKLIVPVHLYGQMAAMDEIARLAKETGCRILEDASQAHGARWQNETAGHWGDVATFSFFPGKNLGAFGDGGAVLSRHAKLIETASMLGKHGGLKKYEHLILGGNSRLDNLQAAMLRIKLKHIDRWNERRRRIAAHYRELLSDIGDIKLPKEVPGAKPVHHLYVVGFEFRDKIAGLLKEGGVETGCHYPLPIHQLPVFRGTEIAEGSYPNAEWIAAHGLSLPMCPTLSDAQVEFVATSLRRIFAK